MATFETISIGVATICGEKISTTTVLIRDELNNALFCTGTADPTGITTAGFAKGCIYIKSDVATGTGGVYLNKGTTAAASFSLVTQA